MIAILRDILTNFAGDLRRGSQADIRALITGIFAALAVSGTLIVVLALWTPAGVFGAMAAGVFLQMFLGWALAGREMRRNR